MKIRRLHEIDLARIASKPIKAQERELKRQKGGFAPFSYNPFRNNFTNIVDAKPPMFPDAPSLSLAEIRDLIEKGSKRGKVEFEQNMILTELLFDAVRKPNITCIQKDFYPVLFAIGHSAAYWANCVLIIDKKPHLVFFDQRRQKGLDTEGRKFVFSMMHHHIREQFPDLYDAGLLIGQFPADGDERRLVFSEHNGTELFSFGELNAMISRTYDLWTQVLSEREEEARDDSSDLGPLFG